MHLPSRRLHLAQIRLCLQRMRLSTQNEVMSAENQAVSMQNHTAATKTEASLGPATCTTQVNPLPAPMCQVIPGRCSPHLHSTWPHQARPPASTESPSTSNYSRRWMSQGCRCARSLCLPGSAWSSILQVDSNCSLTNLGFMCHRCLAASVAGTWVSSELAIARENWSHLTGDLCGQGLWWQYKCLQQEAPHEQKPGRKNAGTILRSQPVMHVFWNVVGRYLLGSLAFCRVLHQHSAPWT